MIGTCKKNSLESKDGVMEGELLQIKDGGFSHSFESPVTRQYTEALSELSLMDRHGNSRTTQLPQVFYPISTVGKRLTNPVLVIKTFHLPLSSSVRAVEIKVLRSNPEIKTIRTVKMPNTW